MAVELLGQQHRVLRSAVGVGADEYQPLILVVGAQRRHLVGPAFDVGLERGDGLVIELERALASLGLGSEKAIWLPVASIPPRLDPRGRGTFRTKHRRQRPDGRG